MIFVATKKGRTTNIFPLLFCCCCWIRDLRSGIRDLGWIKTRIRDKHPGTLVVPLVDLTYTRHLVQTRGAVEGLLPQGELKEEHHTQLKYQLPIAETKLPVVFR